MISFGIIPIIRPIATALLFLAILAMTLALALIFRRRVFCQYFFPVGGFLGTYFMASMTEIRVIDTEICKGLTEKECLRGGLGGWACHGLWKQFAQIGQRSPELTAESHILWILKLMGSKK